MPLQLGRRTAVLSGTVTVDEAEPLATWLRSTGEARVDLGSCDHLHTAALQALLAAGAKVSVPPADAFLRTWIVPLLGSPQPAAAAAEPGVDDAGAETAAELAAAPDDLPTPTLEEVAP